ncbi:ExbD/TolR family protein [Rhodocyclus tenuis]|uniref:Biopolymer transport protein ExbD n=1 Tax=Rhodocyclus tenuis TaxID=1066 RepID=A0A840GJR3_RHOTE|nr:biopolymer transporter ExbD [Rhodocyclus tenuis]MBB4248682.1 biopolymer transport protein ExbD [Rhodocyclus tenuis]MBK1680857.1 hypothetical protein [Rhodocyclus tenuis]
MTRRYRQHEDSFGPARAELNLVPLIDVMLVLLVIVMIASPWLTHAVTIELPRVSSATKPPPPAHVELDIGAKGELYWQNNPLAASELADYVAQAVARDAEVELRIHADRRAAYEHVARAMAIASRGGIGRIGFVSDPER